MIETMVRVATSWIGRFRLAFIVWDFDGTLFRNDLLARDLKARYLKVVAQVRGKRMAETDFDQAVLKHRRWSAAVAFFTSLPEIEVIDLVEKNFNRASYITKNLKLVQSLEALSDYHHVILTNATIKQVEDSLKQIGFTNRGGKSFAPFEKIFARDTTGLLKPDKRAFVAVQRYTQAPAFRHLVIGDSYFEDIKPARLFGFRAIHIDEIGRVFPRFEHQ